MPTDSQIEAAVVDVRALQATVVDKTTDIFSQLKTFADSANAKALSVDLAAPSVSGVSIPVINISSGEVDFAEDTYASALYDALLAKLVEEINSGGYGIDDADEARLFERARVREQENVAVAVDEATQLFASGGFTMPTGAAQAARVRAQREGRDRVSEINSKILSAKADVYITAKGQVLQAGGQLEGVLRQAFSQTQERRLKAVIQNLMSTVEAAVAQGNINIAGAKAAVDLALGKANLQLQAAMKKAEVYASLAQSGMSGLHANVGLSAGASASEGFSGGMGSSDSTNYNGGDV